MIGSLGGEFFGDAIKRKVNENKITIKFLFFGVFYLFLYCVLFFSVSLIIIKLAVNHYILIDKADVENVLMVSLIASVAAGGGSWLFAKIDEHEKNKKGEH